MSDYEVPVLLMGFNRPDKTRAVLEAIRQVRPARLFVAVDGPRPSVHSDVERCTQVRALASAVDWKCDVRTLFRPHNFGSRKAVSTAITWFFGEVEEGIILEDDVVPVPEFFRFCARMLDRYRNDERVAMVAGFNPWARGSLRYSYAFSSYALIWGWATWRRAWRLYDVELREYAAGGDLRFLSWVRTMSPRGQAMWRKIFDDILTGRTDIWDHQWFYAMMRHRSLALLPAANLVSNIGYGSDATHTIGNAPGWARETTAQGPFDIERPPPDVVVDERLERRIARELYLLTPWSEWKYWLRSLLT